MSASEQGINSAAPKPCTARAAMSTAMWGASPQPTEARAKMVRPARKIRRRPNRSAAAPPNSSRAEMQRVYALRIHCIAGRVESSADSMRGRATFTTDSSMYDIADPSTAAASTHSLRVAHAGTGRVARILNSSQGCNFGLAIPPRNSRSRIEVLVLVKFTLRKLWLGRAEYTCCTGNCSPSLNCNTRYLSSARQGWGAAAAAPL